MGLKSGDQLSTLTMASVKPSQLVHSVHAYLVAASYSKAAKALKKEALLDEAGGDVLVELAVACKTWAKKHPETSADDLPRSVHAFLCACQLAKSAKALKKEAAVDGDGAVVPLLDAAALHLKKQRKAAKKAAAAEAAAAAAAPPKKAKKKGSAGARAAAAEEPEEPEVVPEKKKKAKKRKRSASEDERQDAARRSAEKAKRDDAADAMAAWLAKNEATPKVKSPKTPGSARSPGTPFERIDSEKWMGAIKDDRLKDNSYEGTYGDGGWGAKASQKLVQVRGKDFRHEKTKKKRGGYRGGTVDMGSNSIKYHYSDDDE